MPCKKKKIKLLGQKSIRTREKGLGEAKRNNVEVYDDGREGGELQLKWNRKAISFIAIKANLLKMFLDFNMVDYHEKVNASPKDVSQILLDVKEATVQVICKSY